MSPGIGLIKRRLEKQSDAVALAISGIMKQYDVDAQSPLKQQINVLETKYDYDAGDWYVALGWQQKRAIVKMDSIQGVITQIKEI